MSMYSTPATLLTQYTNGPRGLIFFLPYTPESFHLPLQNGANLLRINLTWFNPDGRSGSCFRQLGRQKRMVCPDYLRSLVTLVGFSLELSQV